jgi:hypothetical protein
MERTRSIPERRRRGRGSLWRPEREDLITRVLGSFREMPGLNLTLEQAARLMDLDVPICHAVLEKLVQVGELRRLPSGGYRLAESV